ncbi:MAG: site-specific integrase, partial [Actinomycetia bacterium]|nr:site-specific integrase [Actinomycetes bacterium]
MNDRWAAGHIEARLGSRRVAALTVHECDQFLKSAGAGRFGGPLGRDQLKRLRGRLIKVLENDRRRGLVARNVAKLSVIPEVSPILVPRRPRRALSGDELARLIDASSGIGRVLIDLSSRHGLRPAEARALRWSRVDFDRLTVRIDAQINRANQLVKVKTKRSFRTIRVDAVTMKRLANWRCQQSEAEEVAGFAWAGNELELVATTAVGTPVNQRNVHRTLALASRKAGIDPAVSGYELRHTAITLQIEKEIPVHRVADWAGTSERMIWDVYRHLLSEVTDVGPSDG